MKYFIKVLLLICLMINIAPTNVYGYNPPDIEERYDFSELHYYDSYINYENRFVEGARIKEDLPKDWEHTRTWGAIKYYVGHQGYVNCYSFRSDVLICTFYYDKKTKSFLEYKYNGLFKKSTFVARYKRIDDDNFEKLTPDGKLISTFKREEPLLYWYEYAPDGKLITKHRTRYLPYHP